MTAVQHAAAGQAPAAGDTAVAGDGAVGSPLDAGLVRRLLDTAVTAPGAARRTVLAPYTGRPLHDLPLSTPDDVEVAFAGARRAQRAWAARPLRERAAILLRFHDLMLAHRDEGLDIVQWETGKARKDALEEFLDVLVTTRHYARDASRLLRARRHRGALPLVVGVRELRHPKGVVGVIAPWNYPLSLAASDAVPALMAGNAVVVKPDVQTSLTALWVIDLMRHAGVPESLVAVVTGEGPDIGPAVVDRADYVMFTGSTQTGRLVARRCGERLIGCSLELGGKNALLVLEDADLDRAADVTRRAAFANAGQLCISMERLYVHSAVRDAFLERLLPQVNGLRLAARVGWGADMGSLISATHLARVAGHVDDAVAKGAQVLAGGQARPDIGPYFYEPTVLAHVTPDMEACGEETFGPVLSVHGFDDEDDAVARANDTAYGLNAAVLTRDRSRGRAVAARLRAGTVNVNEGYAPAWGSVRATMGGMGDSGLGRRHGDEGLLKYTESQTVATQRLLGFGAPPGWSDQRWGDTLTAAVKVMKQVGLT
jgi:succinate-semialdehyde dehydrogenase / glutarate-semialdehyde dehydrogenase